MRCDHFATVMDGTYTLLHSEIQQQQPASQSK
jgi:hypothetical protein